MEALGPIVLLWLPLVIIILGLLDAVLMPLLGVNHPKARRISVGALVIISTILIGLTYQNVVEAPIVYAFDQVFGLGIYFKIDLLNYILMLFAGVLFTVVGLFSLDDIKKEEHEQSFYIFYLITYVATIGSLMAGDLLSFFLFFEVMTFSVYGMMVHYRTSEAYEAANQYVYMGVLGGLSILSGILLLAAYTGSLDWVNLADKFVSIGSIKYLIGGLFIFGFGIKAGMVPVHFWMPKTYSSAPFTVPALSSGVLTKVGAYGILRVATVLLFVDRDTTLIFANRWEISEQVGFVVIWLGIISMVVGVMLALMEENVKKMLAYHSVSQMGYVIMGIGVAAYLGVKGPMGYVGAIYHMINHGLFKALLFMVAGVVYMHTKETNMYRLGGLRKKMPLLAVVALIAVFGITGMPFFNGFASKSILHHAIEEAFLYGSGSFVIAEWIFTIVSAGTVASFLKFYSFIFLGKPTRSYDMFEVNYKKTIIPMGILAALIVLIGLNPSWMMNNLLILAAQAINYDAEFISKYLVNMPFFTASEFFKMAQVYVLGALIFFFGIRYHLFHHWLPSWLNMEKLLFKPVQQFCDQFPEFCVIRYEKPMVLGDVFIYVVILTLLIIGLIIRTLWL